MANKTCSPRPPGWHTLRLRPDSRREQLAGRRRRRRALSTKLYLRNMPTSYARVWPRNLLDIAGVLLPVTNIKEPKFFTDKLFALLICRSLKIQN
jgi:hypothetical protein